MKKERIVSTRLPLELVRELELIEDKVKRYELQPTV